MKFGIVITVFNRHQYLTKTLDSLKQAKLPAGTIIVLVDDCSTDTKTIHLFNQFKIEGVGTVKYRNSQTRKEYFGLELGFTLLFDRGCTVACNLDADAIVHPDFANRLIRLSEKYPKHIVSGFNTLTKDATTKRPRHPIMTQTESHYTKRSVGGINLVLSEQLYNKYLKPALATGYGWDWKMCHAVQREGSHFVVSKPSVVQHIGVDSSFNHHVDADVAEDFTLN